MPKSKTSKAKPYVPPAVPADAQLVALLYNLDDVDHFNSEVRHLSANLLLVLKILEIRDMQILEGGEEDSDGLTGAVYDQLSAARERLDQLYTYVNNRWQEISPAGMTIDMCEARLNRLRQGGAR